MTPRDWSDGWDPVMRNSGDPAQLPHQNRCLLLGHWIQFLLAITQWVCPICFQRLLREHDLFDMPTIRAALPGLHFDHSIPALKHTTLAGTKELKVVHVTSATCLLQNADSGLHGVKFFSDTAVNVRGHVWREAAGQ